MPRFSLKDVLRGIMLASIGFGMLAIAFRGSGSTSPAVPTPIQQFLVAFGGMFVGYGLAFPLKYPPHQMIMAGIGMFAAQAWQSGNSFGVIVYVGLTLLLAAVRRIQQVRMNRNATHDSQPPAG